MNLSERLAQAQKSPEYLEEKLKMAFSDAIHNALHRKKLTPKKLAELSGVSHQHILRILHDEINVTFKTVTKIAVALGYDPAISFESVRYYPESHASSGELAKGMLTAAVWSQMQHPAKDTQHIDTHSRTVQTYPRGAINFEQMSL